MLFYLFCMFDDYGGTNHRSSESAGKSVPRHHIYESPFRKTIIDKFLLSQMTGEPKGGAKVGPQGPTPCGGTATPPGARTRGVAALAHQGSLPFAYIIPP